MKIKPQNLRQQLVRNPTKVTRFWRQHALNSWSIRIKRVEENKG